MKTKRKAHICVRNKENERATTEWVVPREIFRPRGNLLNGVVLLAESLRALQSVFNDTMSKGIRNLVSKRKRRFKEDGYDLDLSCILFVYRGVEWRQETSVNESDRRPGWWWQASGGPDFPLRGNFVFHPFRRCVANVPEEYLALEWPLDVEGGFTGRKWQWF